MITLPERPELRAALAKIIAEVCRCDEDALLNDTPFSEIIEHYDSLAMLEILLGIEARFDISTDDMLPPEYRTQEEVAELFPKTLDELADHTYNVVARLNKEEQENPAASRLLTAAAKTTAASSTEKTATPAPAPIAKKATKKVAKKAAKKITTTTSKVAKKAAKKTSKTSSDAAESATSQSETPDTPSSNA